MSRNVRVRQHLRRTETHWYHGASGPHAKAALKEGVLKPGMPSRYHQDVPRYDSVYVTSDIGVAEEYAGDYGKGTGMVFEVKVDPKKLLSDEDSVFNVLDNPKNPLYEQVLRAFAAYLTSVSYWGDLRKFTRVEARRVFEQLGESAVGDPQFVDLAEEMKNLVDWIAVHNPKLNQKLIEYFSNAAHVGPVKIVKRVTARER